MGKMARASRSAQGVDWMRVGRAPVFRDLALLVRHVYTSL